MPHLRSLTSLLAASVVAGAFLVISTPATAFGTIFATNADGSISEYTNAGAIINASVISGLPLFGPQAMTISGSSLFVSSGGAANNGLIGSYTTSGTAINASLIAGLNDVQGLAVLGSNLFVSSYPNGTVTQYDTSGNPIIAPLLSGLIDGPTGIATDGTDLFVAILGANEISEYTMNGTPVNTSLIHTSNLGPYSLILHGDDLFVLSSVAGTVREYTTSGTLVNNSLITGLANGSHIPTGFATDGNYLYIDHPTSTGEVVSQYTLDGTLINGSLISGVQGPLAITAAIPGDVNNDGQVTLTDLNIVLDHLGTIDNLPSDGNLDGNPTIDLADLNEVLNNLGTGNGTPAIPTPEPASLTLLALALPLLRRGRTK